MIFHVVTQDFLGSRGSQSDSQEANNQHLFKKMQLVNQSWVEFKLFKSRNIIQLTVLIIFFSRKGFCETGELKLLCVSIPSRLRS